MMFNRSFLVFLAFALAIFMATPPVFAGSDGRESAQVIHTGPKGGPAQIPGRNEDGLLRLTPDTPHVIHLEQDAASIVVANPAHASVLLDSPRTLIVMPRVPGATTFTVLNARGESIMEKSVIVATASRQEYVRIRRVCGGGGDEENTAPCAENAYFYCPDGCYEVYPVIPPTTAVDVPPVAALASQAPIPTDAIPGNNGAAPAATPGPAGITTGTPPDGPVNLEEPE